MPDVASPLPPRPAASLVVLRAAPAGPEVLMGMRGAGHAFMPNKLVFPGGGVDAADHGAPAASPLRPDVLRRLLRSADPSLAAALGIAAARELWEETGLSLGVPPHLEKLDYVCRAVTPPAMSRRFDARFFAVDDAAVSGTLAGSGELEDVRWLPVAGALALDLAAATRGVLARVCEWLALSPAERAGRAATPVMIDRVWREE